MNEQLKEKLLHYLDVLEEGAQRGSEFIADQAPETVQQWITFTIVSEALLAALFAAIIVGILGAYVFLWKKSTAFVVHGDDFGMWATRTVGALAGLFVFALTLVEGVIPHLTRCLLAWLAPNVFIIKELATLVK